MTDDVAPGQVIADKYRVERVLGEGGMGYVVAAHHLKLDQRVALKFLKPEALKHSHVVQRFAREARAAAKIRGEHVARVIDVGELPNGAPYIVMEYLDGEDLAHVLQRRGPLPIAETVGYMLEACEALAEAHTAGIVHRDLKPPNLFLARTAGRVPTVKLLDFGISKTVDEGTGTDRNLTSTSMIMGTPHYMSPEQLRSSRDVDARSDIWALGVVLFELLSGQVPFDGENTTEVITAIVADPPRSLAELRPDAPAELVDVVQRCLTKFRAERYANVLELARALAPFSPERARGSLPLIERIVMPMLSNAPPPDTAVDPRVGLGTTSFDPVLSAPGSPTVATVDISGGGSQAGVAPARESETRATWNATLHAATGQAPAPKRGLLLAGLAAVLLAGGGAFLILRGANGTPAPEGRATQATSTPAQPAALPAPPVASPIASTADAVASAVPPSTTPEVPPSAATAATPPAPALAPKLLNQARKKPVAGASAKSEPPAASAGKTAAPTVREPSSGSLRMGIK